MTLELILVFFTILFLVTIVFLNRYLFKKRRLISAAMLSPLSLSLFILNVMLILFLIDTDSYDRLTKEHAVATISFKHVKPQLFQAIIEPAYAAPVSFDIHGDQWQLDHIENDYTSNRIISY